MKKRVSIIVMFIILFILVVVLIVDRKSNDNNENGTQTVETYFVNNSTKNLESEKRILQSTEKKAQVDEVLEILLVTGPINKSLKFPSSTELTLLGSSIMGDTAFVYFGEDYNNLTDADKIYLKASITWSLTSIPNINSVVFYVGEEVIKIQSSNTQKTDNSIKYDRSYVSLNPSIDPINSVLIGFTLYFPNEDTNLLEEEQRLNVYANPNTIKEYYIVDELIKGSTTDGLYSAIPKSTKIINVETDNRICYVNLSEDFVSKQTEDERMNYLAVYQIVNSLTLLDNVDAVQIFIDSKKIKAFHNLDLSEVLSRDETILEVNLEQPATTEEK